MKREFLPPPHEKFVKPYAEAAGMTEAEAREVLAASIEEVERERAQNERRLRISVKCGKHHREVDFPIPDELEDHLVELLKVEDAEFGSPIRSEGSRTIRMKITTYGFEKKL